MSLQQMVDPDGKWLYRAGGVSALVFSLAYLLIMALYIPMGARPSGAEAWLASMARNTAAWWAILGLSVLTDFLLVPVALALYLALKRVNRNAMLLVIAFMGLFVVLDLALTWINIAALITLSREYAAATAEAQREAAIAAALYPAAVVESHLIFVYNTLTLAIGILLTGLVMHKGNFGKITAYLALATGILAIVSVASSFFASTLSSVTIILASVLTTAWALFTGIGLYRLGRE